MPPETIEHSHIQTREMPITEVRVLDAEKRMLRVRFMTTDEDGHHTVIPPMSIKKRLKDRFLKNPIFKAGHLRIGASGESVVIGRFSDITIEKDYAEATIQFARTALALDYWLLYSEGFQRAVSIEFRVHKCTVVKRPDGSSMEQYDEIELQAVAAVDIGSNPNALASRAMDELLTRSLETIPSEQREFGERVVEWMRAQGEQRDALTERVATLERELANAMERAGDLETRLDEARDELDALLVEPVTRSSRATPPPHDQPPPKARTLASLELI